MQNTADNEPCLCVKKRYNRHGNDGFFCFVDGGHRIMGKGTKRSHGKPIRGSVRAYHISPYMELLKRLKNSVPSFDEAYRLRDMYKQLTADRLRAALRMGGIYNPLTGTEEIIIFLKQNPRYADLADFVSCTLDYYNNPNLCTVRVQLRNYPSSNQGREGLRSKKNVIRGIKDMQKVFSQDIKQVLKVLETCRFVTEEQRLIIGKYRTISRSVGFLSLLFQTLYAKPLPENITVEQFRKVYSVDPRVGNYYHLDGNQYIRVVKTHKAAALCLSDRAVTTLFLMRLAK